MLELVAQLVVLALVLLAVAAATIVAVRRRRARRGTTATPAPTAAPAPGPTSSPTPSSTPRLRRLPRPAVTGSEGKDLTRRPEQLGIRPLTEAERARYRTAWDGVQSRAEQRPALALCEADAVLDRMLRSCGYPLDDPRSPGDVVPGWHAHVLASFRAGHALEQVNSSARSEADQLSQGMQHFRLAFEAVMAEGRTTPPDAPPLLPGDRADFRRAPGR